MTDLTRLQRVLQKPVITEKASDDTLRRNAYHFQVPIDTNKVEIRQAVERLFDVKVLSVNTARMHPKFRRRGYSQGHTRTWKRAMVTLRDGDTIEVI
jgi:large subunit ribosomal protein L23